MPADPRVYELVGKPEPILTPTEYETQRLQADNTRLQQQQTAQTLKDQAAARQIFQQFGNDPEELLPRLRTAAPSVASAYEKQLGEQRKAALENLKTQNDTQKLRTERGMQMLRMAQATGSEGAYQSARRLLAMDDDDLQAFPAQMPDPDTLGRMIDTGLSIKDVYDLHHKAINHFKDGDIEKGTATALLSAGNDPEAWREALDAGKSMGAGKAFLASFGDQPTPEGVARARDLILTPAEKETARHNVETEKNAAATAARTVASQAETARHNRAMEGNASARLAQGAGGQKVRPVTSGDANKIAEMNNSLRDLDALSGTLEGVKDATGTSAAIGAALPNFVTNATGLGVEAKEKQAVIDRVKQVIGKALEGGVLRKEDEDKYKKILPVISDPPQVVTAKLQGLKAAIERKREEQLSSLEDAGYDTSRYRARVDAGSTAPAQASGGVQVQAPNGTVYTFPNQAQADAFKKRAGIH